jgi:hypothetical protein
VQIFAHILGIVKKSGKEIIRKNFIGNLFTIADTTSRKSEGVGDNPIRSLLL